MQSLKTGTYESLRYRIITHDLRPGELLNEKDLMNQYQIGRTPLREVFLELQREGFVQRVQRTGTFVSPMDFHMFREIIEIRTNLEGLAGQLATKRITKNQLDALERILQKVDEFEARNDDNLIELTKSEFDFHNILYESTQNQKLREILYQFHGFSARFWHYLIFSKQELLDQFKDLRIVMDAFKKKDSKRAKEALENHIQNFVNKVKDRIL